MSQTEFDIARNEYMYVKNYDAEYWNRIAVQHTLRPIAYTHTVHFDANINNQFNFSLI